MTITFHIWKANERVATVEYAPPLTAGDARRGLQDEDSSWIGVLQAEGTSVRLPPQHVLADGATYELILQRQPGRQDYNCHCCMDSLPAANQLGAAPGLAR